MTDTREDASEDLSDEYSPYPPQTGRCVVGFPSTPIGVIRTRDTQTSLHSAKFFHRGIDGDRIVLLSANDISDAPISISLPSIDWEQELGQEKVNTLFLPEYPSPSEIYIPPTNSEVEVSIDPCLHGSYIKVEYEGKVIHEGGNVTCECIGDECFERQFSYTNTPVTQCIVDLASDMPEGCQPLFFPYQTQLNGRVINPGTRRRVVNESGQHVAFNVFNGFLDNLCGGDDFNTSSVFIFKQAE